MIPLCDCQDADGFYPISPLGDLSPCFLSALTTLIALYMVVQGTVDIFRLRNRQTLASITPTWYPVKLMLIVIQTAFAIMLAFYNFEIGIEGIEWLSSLLTLAALFISFTLSYVENYKTYIASSSLVIFWWGSYILGFFRLLNVTLRNSPATMVFLTAALAINAVAIWVLEISAEPKPRVEPEKRVNPEEYANLWSRITFTWLSPLMKLGFSKYLEMSDLPELPEELESKALVAKLRANWLAVKPSLSRALVKSFGGIYFWAVFLKLLDDCLSYAQPQLLKHLIRFVNDYHQGDPLTGGFMIVIAMCALSLFQTVIVEQYAECVFDTGIRIKSSLNCLVYDKSLLLSSQARQNRSTGDIVNLMAVDTQRLQQLTQNLVMLVSAPLQLVICLASLYNLIGSATWIGLVVSALEFPLNTILMRKQRVLQKEQMKVKDERTNLISEMLNNIKSLKLYAWERPYKEKLTYVRNEKELKNLQKLGIFRSANHFIFGSATDFVSTATFAFFLWRYSTRPLSTDIVFTALSLFNMLGFPLAFMPWVISSLIEAQVAIGRLTSYLTAEELDTDNVVRGARVNAHEPCVTLEKTDFYWSDDKPALKDFSYEAKMAELNCIVGRVGAGKSSMLQALLGDLKRKSGAASTKGTIAYVPQIPWIMNGTIKENVLFGCVYDPEFYEQTLKACALTLDLGVLPNGDMTQVGEKGISLSGGQKARVGLARAVYARAEIYIMDDILSAVDEHVGKHIIRNVLGSHGLLQNRCRILSTNNLPVLEYADKITMLAEGTVIEEGGYKELMEKDSNLSQLISEYHPTQEQLDDEVQVEKEKEKEEEEEGEEAESSKLADLEIKEGVVGNTPLDDFVPKETSSSSSEKHEKGKVGWDVYLSYFKACGTTSIIMMVILSVSSGLLGVLANVWLKYWSELNTEMGYNPEPWKNLGIYFGLCMLSGLFMFLQGVCQWLFCSVSGSRVLHQGMLDSVMRAPMEFFETTPIGRILNRFTNDIYKIDEALFRVFSGFFRTSVNVFFTLVVIICSTWEFIFFVIPLGVVYRYYQRYYISSSRELRRLVSVSRSPIVTHFQETLIGAQTIRAYDQTDRFTFLNRYKTDKNMCAYHPSVAANRWLSMRLEFLGSMVILAASGLLIFTLSSGHVTPGLVGLSVSYALQITRSLNWIVRMTVDMESDIVSVERVLEYSRLTPEAPEILDRRPPREWPEQGIIAFDHYSARYRPELDLVLKDVSLSINKKEKIGIVGRTGAGKSSLTLAIFRIIEAAKGHVTIDDVQTNEIGLLDLRSKLSIIPQDSQIFQGTIRSNLDPTNQFTDEDLWDALKLSHLEDHVKKMAAETKTENGLEVAISEGGSNMSVGQRQLMCLARALAKKDCRILVLDEATANVDVTTDSIVQQTIRSAFSERTILTIAHRLNTIIDSDRIIVLDNGKVAEFDSPEKLLERKDSLFYSLCKEGGILNK